MVYRPVRTNLQGMDGTVEDAETKLRRFELAVQISWDEIDALIGETGRRVGEEFGAIFEAQRLMLEDPEWLDPIRKHIEGGASPPQAVVVVSDDIAQEIAALPDPYLAERAGDVRDLATRVLRHLGAASPRTLASLVGSGEVIVAAHDLTPSDTVSLNPSVVRGLITETGGQTSHVAILARQMGIPAVVRVPDLLKQLQEGSLIAIDGETGDCETDPDAETVREYASAATVHLPVRPEKARTRDGVEVSIVANAGSVTEVKRAVAFGADGIGLYRTELLFLQQGGAASEEVQTQTYCDAAQAAEGRPIIFRTLDIGGDKALPGLTAFHEDNPFLGVRGVRFCLQHPDMFRAQLRALLTCGARYPNVRVMIPMVCELEELDQVREMVEDLKGPSPPFSLGVMIEIPSAIQLVPEIAASADFLSVGSNDLTQYLLAADRTNAALGDLYTELHPAVIRALHTIAIAAGSESTPLSICGEMAGRPECLQLLLGLGYRVLSVSPTNVPLMKHIVWQTSLEDTALEVARKALAARRVAEVKDLVERPHPGGIARPGLES